MLWRHVLRLVLDEWKRGTNLIPILSSQKPIGSEVVKELQDASVPIFIAGIGAQGGHLTNLGLLIARNVPALINSSRAILYPYSQDSTNWETSILEAVTSLKHGIQGVTD